MTARDLQAAAARIAEAADGLSRRFAQQLGDVLRGVERRLGPLVADATAGNRTAIVRAAQAARTRRDLAAILEAAGYHELADAATGAPLDRIAAEVLAGRRLASAADAFTPSVARQITALRALQLTDLLDEGEALHQALWRAVVRGVFGTQTHAQILEDLAGVIDDGAVNLRTLYDTNVSIFTRQVEAAQAGHDPNTVFAFMGPADKKNRPFCRQHVGKVYTRAEIDALDNGQLPNVFLTGGGYNCRHVWMEVSKFSELRALVGTGERIPEIGAQLKEAA